jgi:uncharacterized iron-regulated membrane protein
LNANKPYPRLSLAHRWLGVGLGLWFMAVGLTGALLVWRDEIDAWLNPQWFRAPARTAAAPALDLQVLVDKVRDEHGLVRVERIRPPRAAGEALRLQVRAGARRVESGRLEAFVDPASGTLLGLRSLEPVSFAREHAMRTLYELHRNLLLGEPGSNVVGIAGFLLMASAVTGLVVAWPRGPRKREAWRRLVAVAWRANATRLLFDLHRSWGALIAAVLLLATATGATLVYLNYVRDLVSRVSRVEPIPVLPFVKAGRDDAARTLAELVERVHAAFPAHRVAEIRLPERGLTGVTFQLHRPGDVHRLGDTIAWVHPFSGELIAERSARTRSAGEAFMHWLLPLHVGSAFGAAGMVAMCLAGVSPLLLVSSGLWVWWRKRPGERLARERAAERAGARAAERAAERARRR